MHAKATPQQRASAASRVAHPLGTNWKGDLAKRSAGWYRATVAFPVLGICAECEAAPARERHHWDGNPLNNDRNIVPVCRRCHMRLDGRLERMAEVRRKRDERTRVAVQS